MPTKSFQHVDFAFIIPTYTNTSGLLRVLENINQLYPKAHVVIINNDGSKRLEKKIDLKAYQFGLIVINNHMNVGYGKAINDGSRQAKEAINPKYLVFLNDDVRFDKDWVLPCMRKLEKKKWIAAAPTLVSDKGTAENYGYRVLPYGKIELIKDSIDGRPIDGLTAAALVFKQEDFFRLEGFDPIFFAYLEDVDLFLRAKKQGMRFGIVKEITVMHGGQETSLKFPVKKAYLDFKNWIILIGKNWGFKKIILNFPSIFVERLRNLWGVVRSIF